MTNWGKRIATGPIPVAVALGVVLAAISLRLAPADEERAPALYRTSGALDEQEAANVVSAVVARYESASVHHLEVNERVAAHYHRLHDETVVVLSGAGKMRLGDAWHELAAGDVLAMPRGTVHALEVTEAPLAAVSVFSPAFDGQDRHFLAE